MPTGEVAGPIPSDCKVNNFLQFMWVHDQQHDMEEQLVGGGCGVDAVEQVLPQGVGGRHGEISAHISNAARVRAYYKRRKPEVIFRKVLARCREHGSVPGVRVMCEYAIPMCALLAAFGEWASAHAREPMLTRQGFKLQRLRRRMSKYRVGELVSVEFRLH